MEITQFLKQEYREYLEGLGDGEDSTAVVDEDDNILLLDSFLNWAKQYLSERNPPINVRYPTIGLGLVLQQGEMLEFSDQPVGEGTVRSQSYDVFQNQEPQRTLEDRSAVSIFGGKK